MSISEDYLTYINTLKNWFLSLSSLELVAIGISTLTVGALMGPALLLFPLWLFFSVFVGDIAAKKMGRSGIGFFLLSMVLSPLIGLICVLIIGPDKKHSERGKQSDGDHKKCEFCAEIIKIEAKTCKFCHNEQPPSLPES